MERSRVEALLAPESIAIVGASPDSWYASRLVDNLLSYGFDGPVYYVNPSRESIDGEPCYDSITDVPTVVDLVVVSIPREHVVDAVRDAATRGVPAALVISAGFAEADGIGASLQDELGRVVEEHGIALCGPNTIGFANMHDEVVVSATCSRKPEPGSIGLVSQSGALAFSTFFDRATDEDLRFSYIVATGNEVGLGFSDYVEFMTDDPRVDVICVYLEGVRNPRRFMTAASRAVRSGTPVVAVKIGRSPDAERASVSHTGSITGNDDAWNAAFDQSGVERVEDIPDLLDRATVHAAFDPPASNRVCVLSTSGGLASLLADLVSDRGLELPPLSEETERTLLERDDLLTFGHMPNPADIRGYGADILPEIAEIVLEDDRFDAYLIAIALPAVGERAEPLMDSLLTVAEMAEKPVVVVWTGRKEPDGTVEGPLPYQRVRRALPLYYDPARAVDALASLVRFGEVRERALSAGGSAAPLEPPSIDLPRGSILRWSDAESLLAEVGVEPIRTIEASDPDDAAAAAEQLGFPVVMKVDAPDLPHRTDAGAVRLGIESTNDARRAYREVTEAATSAVSTGQVERVLVQPMVDGVEALVGVSDDEVFGPVITIGVGGELVELLEDRIVLIPPVDRDRVHEALAGSTLDELLSGYRGREPADREALVDLVVRVGDLVVADDRIDEMDLNPVMVGPAGATIVDVLVSTRE